MSYLRSVQRAYNIAQLRPTDFGRRVQEARRALGLRVAAGSDITRCITAAGTCAGLAVCASVAMAFNYWRNG